DLFAMEAEPVLLDETLRPSPPMNPRALLVILAVTASFNIAFALSFILRGAWPIAPFMGLDVALLAWAFRASSLAAQRFEHVTLTPSLLCVEKHPVKGAATKAEFNPYWVRVDLQQPTEFSNRLFLRSHGREMQVGDFLAPAMRESFANALKSALSAAKNRHFGAQETGR
ncbi:MAG TPA: DUF2244 domain-containing protein, partial [Rhizomicrobium sp.]|nr:DUF2244 domain-containing protein [Rhizomicrobium sp.]